LNKIKPLDNLYSVFQQSFTNIKMKNATIYEIKNKYWKLKSNRSCGCDGMTTEHLQISSWFISSPLPYICSGMLSAGTVLERLRFSEIKSVSKKFDKTLISNYRPISLLSVISKIFEKFIYKTLYYHLTSNNILFKEQFGFGPIIQLK